MNLRLDVFFALATVVTADGVITPEERTGLLEAARAAELTAAEIASLERALDGDPATSSGDWAVALTPEERAFVYSAAVWLAGVDGVVTEEETATVKQIGDRLGLSEGERSIASLAASGFTSTGRRDVLGLSYAIAAHQRQSRF
jgi:uncharacterized tellurite resistance protein B-like protein